MTGLALAFCAPTVTRSARVTFSKTPGTKDSFSVSASPLDAMISGFHERKRWLRSSEISMISNRSCTSTCVAARPIPGAAYMVSAMS